MRSIHTRSSKRTSVLKCIIALLILQLCCPAPTADASIISANGITTKISNWINGEDENQNQSGYTMSSDILTIIDISEMRVRDIKRRLTRQHGYGADEIAVMLDKKELINALAYEEHKTEQKEKDRKKRVALRRSIIVALICVIFVMFKGLFVHVLEVASINFVVYTDKKKYEWSRCRELQSIKGLFGLFLMVIVNMLQLWLSTSVMLSWVMKSKYFFPVPHIPIKPAGLLAAAAGTGGAGPLADYGINVGPMFISALFRFLNGRVELFMGKALAQAVKRQRKVNKAARKEEDKKEAEVLRKERKAARRARRAEREIRRQAAAAVAAAAAGTDTSPTNDQEEKTKSDSSNNDKETKNIGSNEEKQENLPTVSAITSEVGGMDELD